MIAAMIFDLRYYKIPNLLIIIGVTMGISWSCYKEGWRGILDVVAGIALPIITLFILHQLRMLGAGDIKLFAVVGSFVGHQIWIVMLYSFVAGGCLAVIQMLVHRSLVSRMKAFWKYSQICFQTRKIIPYESGFDQGDTRNTIHFSIAIFIGCSCWLLERWLIG